jgi:hypothetical protein
MFIIWGIFSLVFWIPLVALLLWALTFITYSITFSWAFVLIVSGVAGLITGIWAGNSN